MRSMQSSASCYPLIRQLWTSENDVTRRCNEEPPNPRINLTALRATGYPQHVSRSVLPCCLVSTFYRRTRRSIRSSGRVTAHSETIRQSAPTLDQNPPSAPDVWFWEVSISPSTGDRYFLTPPFLLVHPVDTKSGSRNLPAPTNCRALDGQKLYLLTERISSREVLRISLPNPQNAPTFCQTPRAGQECHPQ